MKECYIHIRAQLAKISRHHPQVVVMQPYRRTFRCLTGRLFCKLAVYLTEHIPVIFFKARSFPKGMQRWPEGFFREAFVKDIHFLFR